MSLSDLDGVDLWSAFMFGPDLRVALPAGVGGLPDPLAGEWLFTVSSVDVGPADLDEVRFEELEFAGRSATTVARVRF